jgi:hypothetical protein
MAAALPRFRAEGAWGVSPHMIPHRSLHAPSGALSHALKAHGPNFGVGGATDGAAEALISAAGLLALGHAPAVWAVVSHVRPDGDLDDAGRPAPGAVCEAVAVALVPARPAHVGLRLTVSGGPGPDGARGPFRLGELLALLDEAGATPTGRTHVLPDGSRIELALCGGGR